MTNIYIYMCGMVGMVSMSKLKKLKQKNAKTRWQLGGSWGEGLGGGGVMVQTVVRSYTGSSSVRYRSMCVVNP